MWRAAVLLLVVVTAAGCGGGRPKPEHATLTDVHVASDNVRFTFDSEPQTIKARWAPLATVAECGSGFPVRAQGSAWLLVNFSPAQTSGVPKRIVMPSGPVLEVDKVCDFEADVGWVIGVGHRLQFHVSRDGATVTVSFGG